MSNAKKRAYKQAVVKKFQPKKKKKFPFGLLYFILAIILILATKEFIIINEEGKAELSPERKAKLAKELEELEHAEQYVLLAMFNDFYPCYNCGKRKSIFLIKGSVWKYGVTRKGGNGRYGSWHKDRKLFYFAQFEGTLQECLRLEKTKIYHFAIHPENLIRSTPLLHPPGNKQDN